MTRSLVSIGALLLILLAAGCGGDDNKQSLGVSVGGGATVALSKADFIAQGNAICVRGNQQLQAAQRQLGSSATQADVDKFVVEKLVPMVQDQVDQIRALGAPAGDEDTVAEMLDSASAALQRVAADPQLLSTTGTSPFADSDGLLDAYGLSSCGSHSGESEAPASTPAPGDTVPGNTQTSPAAPPAGASTDSNDDGISDPYGE